jgi:DNA-binding Xre family transcriptional regulator
MILLQIMATKDQNVTALGNEIGINKNNLTKQNKNSTKQLNLLTEQKH